MKAEYLLLVDVQYPFVSSYKKTTNKIRKFVTDTEINIISTTFENSKNSMWNKELDWDNTTKVNIPEWVKINSKQVFTRQSYNAIQDKSLISYYENRRIESCYIAGFETDACVLATAYGLFSADITPIVITPLCATKNNKLHQKSIKLLERNIGEQNIVRKLPTK